MSSRQHTAEFAEGRRNAIPLGIRHAYTFSWKRWKYYAATNKNMYRVFGVKSAYLSGAVRARHFPLCSRAEDNEQSSSRKFGNLSSFRVKVSSRSQENPSIFFRTAHNSADSKGVKMLSEWFIFLPDILLLNLKNLPTRVPHSVFLAFRILFLNSRDLKFSLLNYSDHESFNPIFMCKSEKSLLLLHWFIIAS